ncbi:hypothetical protein NM208_g9918 [Fusarium decemcellulare]|uniref:Uncharacterized protein n=1 Tax=Fusarium decemcellulare TaxID=57161 RepID=A0ACC1S0B2_9HYPO|nr:hypothetical protein NM208_g9918 [Fusarium decemcellulare]
MTEQHENPLQELPIELQRNILVALLSSIEITPVLGDPFFFDEEHQDEGQKRKKDRFYYRDDQGKARQSDTTPLYQFNKVDIDKLGYYGSIFLPEAHEPWERHVRFNFPTCLAMYDVLLGPDFPPTRRKLVKKIKVSCYPIAMIGTIDKVFQWHFLDQSLNCVMDGLELDVLEYTDVFLPRGADENRRARIRGIYNILKAPRWKTLLVRSHELHLTTEERDKFGNLAEEIRDERDEPGFCCDLDIATESPDRKQTAETSGEDERPCIMAKRGVGADLSPGDPGFVTIVMTDKPWHELRLDGSYLVWINDDDPTEPW